MPLFLLPEIGMTIFKNPIHNGDLNFVHKPYAHHQQTALFLRLFEKRERILFQILPEDRVGFILHRLSLSKIWNVHELGQGLKSKKYSDSTVSLNHRLNSNLRNPVC